MTTLAEGRLLMNGATCPWPPRDVDGTPVHIGALIYGMRDTYNLRDEYSCIVGALRLQNHRGELRWVVCAYDDDMRYYECYSEDCKVMKSAPLWARLDG